MNPVKVKICGITCLDDALFAAGLGVDALGFNFYPGSPRYIAPEDAAGIIRKLPPFVKTVGLFVNAQEEQIRQDMLITGVDLLQFHGDEDDDFCRVFDRPYLKVIRLSADTDVVKTAANYPYASAILLDTYIEGAYGGTGKSFDWARVPRVMDKPVVLAGGLTAGNVATAIRQAGPYAVDVSGGVESAKGKKDKQKMTEFVNAVKGCV